MLAINHYQIPDYQMRQTMNHSALVLVLLTCVGVAAAFSGPGAAMLASSTTAFQAKWPTMQPARIGTWENAISRISMKSLQDDLDVGVARLGRLEQSYLQAGTPLTSPAQTGGGQGFGGKMRNKNSINDDARVLAKELRRNGVVRIDGVLSEACADALRDCVDNERERALNEVEANVEASTRFADLVLLSNRCDLLMPLRGPVVTALQELLGESSRLAPLLEQVAGKDATLQEVACLISEPGSCAQPMHPDIPYTPVAPLFAAFVALQDVTIEMGPTVYLPGTHTKEAHDAFYAGSESDERGSTAGNEEYLRAQPVVRGLLKKGDCAVYNQQVIHCGSANTSESIRRQFYVAVRNAQTKIKGYPSIRPSFLNQMSLSDVREELKGLARGKGGRFEEMNLKDQAASGFSY